MTDSDLTVLPADAPDSPRWLLDLHLKFWRKAINSQKRDAGRVFIGLAHALNRRGLGEWTMVRYPDPMSLSIACLHWRDHPLESWQYQSFQWKGLICSTPYSKWELDDFFPWDEIKDVESHTLKSKPAVLSYLDDALVCEGAALYGWTTQDSGLLTVGMLEAVDHGLGMAAPCGPETLGWVMAPPGERPCEPDIRDVIRAAESQGYR